MTRPWENYQFEIRYVDVKKMNSILYEISNY